MLIDIIFFNDIYSAETTTSSILLRCIEQSLFGNFDQLISCHVRPITHGIQSWLNKWTPRPFNNFITCLICAIFIYTLYLELIEPVLTCDDVWRIQLVFVTLFYFAHQFCSLWNSLIIASGELYCWLLMGDLSFYNLRMCCVSCM